MRRTSLVAGLALLLAVTIAWAQETVPALKKMPDDVVPVQQPAAEPAGQASLFPPTEPKSGTGAADPKTETGTVPLADPKTETGTVPLAEPKPETGTVPPADPKTETGTVPLADPKTGTGIVPPADPKTDSGIVPVSASKPGTGVVAATEPVTAPLPNLGPAPEKSPDPAPSVKDIGLDAALGQTNDNPTGRQEPALSLEWIGPASAKVGQPVTFQIMVKNISANRVYQAVLHNRLPVGVTLSAAEPKGTIEDNMLVWQLGTMEPRQEKRIDLQLVPATTGSLACQAFVTFTGISVAKLDVHEPRLVIKTFAPKNVIAGDPATVVLTVSNPGDAVAENVKVKAMLSEGLEHARGKNVEFDLGNLAPNESRNVFVLCAAKAPGEQKCEAVATGEPKLTAHETANIDVLTPRLNLTATGPGMRYLDRHAIIVFKVTNPGTAPANHVTLVNRIPLGFKVVAATAGGQHDFVSRTVSWFLGDLGAGESKEVNLELVAVNPGEHHNQAVVTGARGLRSAAEVSTRIEGLPALLMEVVDLDDPLEVGAETSYEIRVTNTGTKTETNLQLTCTVPDKMQFRGAQGAAGTPFKHEGSQVIFEPLPKLAPRADAIYRVKVRGLAAGDLRFQARIKADGLTAPVLKEESTKVYGDEAEPLAAPKKE